ncbi:S8 family serine peptidase [Aliikangiella sp. G2MR2-5]|uniref:S8 family serine peptidase n=1 Tax=Aliikangiella sp. G2MR2-5 TaxID=2788943 RepID=UPI0018ABC03E|nr:S8 family serine peptidase [Aliikangiella sp. G2MR2-5]
MITKLTKVTAATLMGLGISAVSAAEETRYIVKYKEQGSQKVASQAKIKSAVRAAGGKVVLPLNAMGAAAFTGDTNAVARLRSNPNIEYVEVDEKRELKSLYNDDAGNPMSQQLTPYAIYQSQADQLSLDLANAKRVCVIDSGIAGDTGETGGRNNDFDWNNITGSNDSGTGDWFRDGGPHGTHVAGTIAAADNGYGVIGMAPGNPLHIVKVFNAAGWGYSSDLAKAAQECSNAGASIISMSLGGGRANRTEESAFDSFTANGGLVLAAAGNDGNSTRSYPAGYESVMMIGANDGDNNIASFSQFPSCRNKGKVRDGYCVEVTAGGVNTLSTYPSGGATLASMEVDGVGYASSAMENGGTVTGNTYDFGLGEATDNGASGKICVISRGNITFHDKVKNCEDSGGIGAIIYNNEPGMLYGTLGDTNTTSIPAVGATQEDGAALVASTSATISIESSDFGYMSGTSMATPGVSGVAALVWSNHPGCSGTEIRNALKATAQDSGAAGKDDYFGYGIVKAKAASDYLTANGCSGQ